MGMYQCRVYHNRYERLARPNLHYDILLLFLALPAKYYGNRPHLQCTQNGLNALAASVGDVGCTLEILPNRAQRFSL